MALCLVLLCSKYSNSQTVDTTTGNLTNFTGSPTDTTSVWNNAGSVGAPLTCWAGGDPGYCGPNPRVSAWGAGSNVINFSYGQVDLNQVVNINKALAIGGSGVQLSGFNFGFTAKNGNGWDNGQQDYLSAYVKFYNSGGGLAANYDYTSQTNRRYNWTTFNFSETFSSTVPATNFSNAQYGFVGRDTNYWVGPYGPEIMNVNFSLKYTVKPDPCISDPLSSPTCPGYALATVKNSILGSTVSNASATSFVPTMNYTQPAPAAAPPAVADAAPALAQLAPQQQAQQPAQQPAQQGPLPPAPGQDPNQNPGGSQDNPAQPSPQQAGPAPTQPQPAGGPPQTASAPPPQQASPQQASPQQAGPQQGGGSGPSKLAMSVVKSVQAKDQATQQTAVQNAAKAFESTQQSSQASSNAAITMNQDMSANSATAAAQFANQATQASTQMSMQGPQQQSTQSSSLLQQTNNSTQVYSGNGLSFGKLNIGGFNTDNFNNSVAAQITTQTQSTMQFRNELKTFEIEQPQMQVASFSGLGKAGSPLSDMMNQRMDMLQTNIEQRAESVKRNVQPNELAGGTDVAAMAQIPRGYEAYSIVMLRDAPFYKPETIYKNQTTVDNARVFRGLTGGSDAKHQEMVNSQYNLGN